MQKWQVSVVNQEKAKKDALYDGYFAIITGELDYDARPLQLNRREQTAC